MGNNPKLDLVNVDVHTKFGQILSIRSQDIERKQKCRKDGRTEGRNNGITELRKDRVNPVWPPLFQSGAITIKWLNAF